MLSEQQSATQETMKATMRMRRPMIIRAATALAQAAEESRGGFIRGEKKPRSLGDLGELCSTQSGGAKGDLELIRWS